MRALPLLVTTVLLAAAMAGCFSGQGGGDDVIPDPNYTGNNTTEPPRIEAPVIPPCTLQSGGLEWPEVEGAQKPEMPTEATIMRDDYGVPHIYAEDAYSLWYANGYAQAQDRLFQMDVLRHVGRGDSAEYLGPSQLESDFEVRRELYTPEEIEAQYQAMPAGAQEVLQAFSDGVNRFIAEAVAQDRVPAEFPAVGHEPHPWQPQDSVALINYLIGVFGVAGGQELGNLQRLAQLQDTVGTNESWDALGDLVWLRITDSYTTIDAEDKVMNGCEDEEPEPPAIQLRNLDAAADAVTFGGDIEGEPGLPFPPMAARRESPGKGIMEGFHWGSNALLADGSITETGKPIMWGAPQMGYFKPPVPYQVGLHGAGYDAAGIGVAGAPGIVIGQNADIAWTATSGIEDQVDLVEVELDGARSYLWDGESRDMECWTHTHSTSPAPADLAAFPDVGPPQTYDQEICRAEGWPVVAINEDAGVAWFKRTTTRGEELPGAYMWLGLARAQSAQEFQDMVADFPFTFNFHVADGEGIRYIHTGDIPLRAEGYDPRLPTPAGSAYVWRGEAYTAEMGTSWTDPSSGYFANWNNGPVYGWRAGDQRGLYGPVHRVQAEDRVIQSYLADGSLSWQDVANANWDAARTDSLAMPFMPHLIAAAESEPGLADVAQVLRDWRDAGLPWRDDDGDGRYDDPGHAVWDGIYADMLDRIQGDELGTYNHDLVLDPKDAGDPHAGDHGEHSNPLPTILKALQGTTAHAWCDDVGTDEEETCPEQLVAGLQQVRQELVDAYGDDPGDWTEPVHHSRFTPIGGTNPDERPMVNRGSWVQVVAIGEGLDGAGSALPPANSGLITGPELAQAIATGDEPARLTLELDLYWAGDYKPFPVLQADVTTVSTMTETLTIVPPP